jgi:hypothetical protein
MGALRAWISFNPERMQLDVVGYVSPKVFENVASATVLPHGGRRFPLRRLGQPQGAVDGATIVLE